MTGFDQRPAVAHPIAQTTAGTGKKSAPYREISTPKQFADEVTEAVRFIGNNPTVDPSKLLLIYSWGENSEGGGALNLTLGDPGGERLKEIKPLIQ
jgi:hypothetical protein